MEETNNIQQAQPEVQTEPIIVQGGKTPVGLIIFVILLTGLIFGLLGYYLGKQGSMEKVDTCNVVEEESGFEVIEKDEEETESTETPTQPTNLCITNKDQILDLVSNFEKLQKDLNGTGVLALFTPAKSEAEKDEYDRLSRLYNNVSTRYKTESYKVISDPVLSNGNCVVNVEEMRSYYGGPDNPVYKPAEARNFMLELQKVDSKWIINQYQSLESNIKKTKYAGFLMEISY